VSTPVRIVLILFALLVLALGGIATFLLTLDPERYRDEITQLVRDRTGLHVRLDGPITWSIWPSISLGVDDAAADWTDAGKDAEEPPLVQVRRVRFEVGLLPLLSTTPRLEVASVVLDGVRLDLRVGAEGSTNWLPPDTATPPDAGAGVSAPEDGDAGPPTALTLASLKVTDLGIRYRDAVTGTDARLEGLELVATSGSGGRIDLTLGGRAELADGPRLEFDGRIGIDPRAASLRIEDAGALIHLPDVAEPVRVRLAGRLIRDGAGGPLRAEGLELRVADLVVRIAGSIETRDGGDLNLELDIPRTDLRKLLAQFDAVPDTSDPEALRRFSGEIDLSGSFDAIRLEPVILELDNQRLTGSAGWRTGPVRPTLEFRLAAGRLDPTRWLPPAEEEAEAAAGPLVTDAELGFARLDRIDLDGEIRADALTLPGLALGPTRINLDNRAGRLQARIEASEVLGGQLEATVGINGTEAVPTLTLRLDAVGLDAGRLAPDLGFEGPVSLRGNLDGNGDSTAALAKTLRGRLDLTGAPGTLDVTELRAGLLQIARILGRGERIAQWPDRLAYQSLTGAWILAGGLDDQRLNLAVDNLDVDATGGLNPATGVFDFRAGARFAARTPRSFDVPAQLEGVRLPLRCRGELAESGNPCGFDQQASSELVRQLIRSGAAEPVLKKIDEQLPENLRAPTRELLRGLFGTPREQTPQPEAER
jgi:AsmA protein